MFIFEFTSTSGLFFKKIIIQKKSYFWTISFYSFYVMKMKSPSSLLVSEYQHRGSLSSSMYACFYLSGVVQNDVSYDPIYAFHIWGIQPYIL